MRSRILAFARFLVAALVLALGVSAPRLARAGGTVTVADSQPKEVDGRWTLKMTMNYGGVPPTAHIPMSFEFTMTVLYERSLTDQSPKTPVLTKKPLANQPPINESMDVGFSDATGKIFNITKFDFPLRRDRGYEAGEYNLVITRTSDGQKMGSSMRIVLQGDNEIVDRRAMVFTGEKKEKKADATEKKDETPASGETPANAGEPEGDTSGTPVETPPAAPPKQGGCGCHLADSPSNGAGVLALLAGFGALSRRRRRRSPGSVNPRISCQRN
jgi:MYXO-CTERM domain-containing protein